MVDDDVDEGAEDKGGSKSRSKAVPGRAVAVGFNRNRSLDDATAAAAAAAAATEFEPAALVAAPVAEEEEEVA
jgi:hypothetical protein